MSDPQYPVRPEYPGYPAPSASSTPPPGMKPAPPSLVGIAFWLYVLAAALSIVGFIVSLANVGSLKASLQHSLQTSGQSLPNGGVDSIVAIGLVIGGIFALVWVVVYVLFAVFMKRGANWARIVLTVLAALSLFNILGGYGLGAAQAVAAIVATVLIWLRPANDYFHAVKASKGVGRM